MLEKVFSVAYAPGRQQDFVDALDRRDYQFAGELLEGSLPGGSREEKFNRIIMLQEGYHALSQRLIKEFDVVLEKLEVQDERELDNRLDEIRGYEEKLKKYKDDNDKLRPLTIELRNILDRLDGK